jgi:hypothetical protein
LFTVYVGDSKLAVPEVNLSEGWWLISKRINVEKPSKAGLYLGCLRGKKMVELKDGEKVTARSYNVESYLAHCVLKYFDLVKEYTGKDIQMKRADAPFLLEDQANLLHVALCLTVRARLAPFVGVPIPNWILYISRPKSPHLGEPARRLPPRKRRAGRLPFFRLLRRRGVKRKLKRKRLSFLRTTAQIKVGCIP